MTLKDTIQNIAQQIPGYTAYQMKERRRDADQALRLRLAEQYSEQRAALARVQKSAVSSGNLEYADDLEALDQKLSRFIERLRLTPRGYAGWFDAAQIQETDLDQLVQFDANLADGVDQTKSGLAALTDALKSKTNIAEAIDALAALFDALNARLDQRSEFLAMGKRPAPSASPLGVLQAKKPAAAPESAFEQLKMNDAVSYGGRDYLVAGRVTYAISSGKFSAVLLEDRGEKRWLRVGPANEIAVLQEISYSVPSPLPNTLTYQGTTFTLAEQGAANVSVEGAGGLRTGSVNYARYGAEGGARLWIEDWGTETKVQFGQIADPFELKLYRKL